MSFCINYPSKDCYCNDCYSRKVLNEHIYKCGLENTKMSGCHAPVIKATPCQHGLTGDCDECDSISKCIWCREEVPCGCALAMVRDIDDRITALAGRIKEVERFQDITHAQHENVIRKKQPHKCPACEGSTLYRHSNDTYHLAIDCKACEGKGIVWG